MTEEKIKRRDLFAAHALTGFLSQRVASEEEDRSLTFLAQLSYRMADQMIAQGERPDDEDEPD